MVNICLEVCVSDKSVQFKCNVRKFCNSLNVLLWKRTQGHKEKRKKGKSPADDKTWRRYADGWSEEEDEEGEEEEEEKQQVKQKKGKVTDMACM